MANYEPTSRTNYFRVTDEKRYKELFSGLCGGAPIKDFTKTNEGKVFHGFGCYGAPFWTDPDEEVEDGFDTFVAELQKILPPDEAFIYLESGFENLRYVTGSYIVATSADIQYGDINAIAIDTARNMLGNKEFSSQLDY